MPPFCSAALCKDMGTLLSELRITRAYMRLLFVPPNEDGTKTVSLARIGNYEVLLVELSQSRFVDGAPLWLELYAHDLNAVIDSYRCTDVEEAASAAEQLISCAKVLQDAASGQKR
jgi:hypothetical protein